MYSSSPSNLISRHFFAYTSTFPKIRTAAAITLALFSLVLSMSMASAQTRARRVRAEAEKNSRRADNKKRPDDKKVSSRIEDRKRISDKNRTIAASDKRANTVDKKRQVATETARRDNPNQVTPNPLVRKTSLTYAPKTPGQSVTRSVLVNDIIVVSRAAEKPASTVLLPAGSRASSAPANIPSIWPVMGTLRSGVGIRSNPFGGSSREYHKGQDISAPMGTSVIATADGTVTIAGWQRGYGWVVYIDHGNGISTRYGHLSRIDVTVGQTIRRGEQLGLVGSTGRSTGPHLHYEVRINGQPVSPLQYLPLSPVTATAQTGGVTRPGGQR